MKLMKKLFVFTIVICCCLICLITPITATVIEDENEETNITNLVINLSPKSHVGFCNFVFIPTLIITNQDGDIQEFTMDAISFSEHKHKRQVFSIPDQNYQNPQKIELKIIVEREFGIFCIHKRYDYLKVDITDSVIRKDNTGYLEITIKNVYEVGGADRMYIRYPIIGFTSFDDGIVLFETYKEGKYYHY